LSHLLEIVIVLAVMSTMILVGRRQISPASLLIGGWFLLVPLVAGGLVSLCTLPPALAGGILLVAVAPIGTMSNFYALVSGASVAVALTLMAFSTLLTVVTVPVISWLAFNLLFSQSVGIEVPFEQVLKQSAMEPCCRF
jgi:predicted Na+-dependent transporter